MYRYSSDWPPISDQYMPLNYVQITPPGGFPLPPSGPYVSVFIFGGKDFPDATSLTFVPYAPRITVYEALSRAGVRYDNRQIVSIAETPIEGSVRFRLLLNRELIDPTLLTLQLSPYDLLEIDLVRLTS